MRLTSLLAALAASAALGACATTGEPAAEAAAPAASAESTVEASATAVADKTEVVCRNVQITGTRFPEKICRTREEWSTLGEGNDPTSGLSRRALQQNMEGG